MDEMRDITKRLQDMMKLLELEASAALEQIEKASDIKRMSEQLNHIEQRLSELEQEFSDTVAPV